MERNAQTPPSPSLKKLKREASQRRKANARALKLRAEEKDRHIQRLEIDTLVERQLIQRLERQRCEEATVAAAAAVTSAAPRLFDDVSVHHHANGKGKGGRHHHSDRSQDNKKKQAKDGSSGITEEAGEKCGKGAQKGKQGQQHSIRAGDSRRRLARGPRSGITGVDGYSPTLPSLEDHRVLSTEYHAAGTQALMRVTLLAAGFVIGARGISARLIGQVTGAIVQSWTECCCAGTLPIRLFRIQGKKSVVLTAVDLIEQAVAKYKDLCDCKRRGEFVQREHMINGVEFYYQPPPRKSFALSSDLPSFPTSSLKIPVAVPPPLNLHYPPLGTFAPQNAWLQHFHARQQQANSPTHDHNSAPQHSLYTWNAPEEHEEQLSTYQEVEQAVECQQTQPSSSEEKKGYLNVQSQPISQRSIASLEHALQQVKLDQQQQRLQERRNYETIGNEVEKNDFPGPVDQTKFPPYLTGSSFFSVFGNGGLPLPIAQVCRLEGHPAASVLMNSPASTTPFDLRACDFFREILPAFSFARQDPGLMLTPPPPLPPTYALFDKKSDVEEGRCVVCFERPARVRLMTCGHSCFCLSCVHGTMVCPLCHEKIIGLQDLGPKATESSGSGFTSANFTYHNSWSRQVPTGGSVSFSNLYNSSRPQVD